MAQETAPKAVESKKRKHWYQIVAPKAFKEDLIGETLSSDLSNLMNKSLTINLMNLTGDAKKQNINLTFEIVGTSGDKALTSIKRYEMSPSYIKRVIRRGRDRVDDSFVCLTKDKKTVRIKILLITTVNTKNAILKALKKSGKEYIKAELNNMDYYDLMEELIMHKFQSNLNSQLKKIFPLKVCEIRSLSIEKQKEIGEEKKDETAEKPKEDVTEKKEEIKKEAVKKEGVEEAKEEPKKEKKAKKESKKPAKKKATKKAKKEKKEEPKKEEVKEDTKENSKAEKAETKKEE